MNIYSLLWNNWIKGDSLTSSVSLTTSWWEKATTFLSTKIQGWVQPPLWSSLSSFSYNKNFKSRFQLTCRKKYCKVQLQLNQYSIPPPQTLEVLIYHKKSKMCWSVESFLWEAYFYGRHVSSWVMKTGFIITIPIGVSCVDDHCEVHFTLFVDAKRTLISLFQTYSYCIIAHQDMCACLWGRVHKWSFVVGM